MEAALRAGIAVYNAGEHHAAHDAWEDRWRGLDRGTDDERLLHGLIQFTAAVYHARRRNWSGATGLAGSAGDYLAGLPADYRAVNVGEVREYLGRLAADPELIERRRPPALAHRGERPTPGDLGFGAAAVAAVAIAAGDDAYEAAVLERAARYAREERAAGDGRTRFVGPVMDFAADPGRRGLVYDRLRRHVERRRAEEAGVEGLFD